MPRGKRKRGAWEFRFWFEDGSRYEVKSLSDRTFTDVDIANAIREYVLPVLASIEKKHEEKNGSDRART